jgi:hypothetical protein
MESPGEPTPTPSPAAPATPATPATPAGEPTPAGAPTPQSPQPGQAGSQQQPAQLTPEQIADIAAQAGIRAQQTQRQQEQQQEPQLTQEQIEQQFNFIRPKGEDMETLFAGGEPAIAKMTELLHGTVKMANTIAGHFIKREVDKVRAELRAEFGEQIGPAREMANEKLVEKHTNAFYEVHPELKPFEATLKHVYATLAQSGFKGTPEQVYAKIAEEAKKLITQVNPDAFAPGQQAAATPVAGAKPATTPNHRMSTLSNGGGSGGAGATPSGGAKTTAEKLFA